MASAEREPIMGVRGRSPHEAESLLASIRPAEAANLPHSVFLQNL